MKNLPLILLALLLFGCTSGKYLGAPPDTNKEFYHEKKLYKCRDIDFKDNHIIITSYSTIDSAKFIINYGTVVFFEKVFDDYIYFDCNGNWKIVTDWGNKYRRNDIYERLLNLLFKDKPSVK